MANKKILLGLTTMAVGEWKNKVKEIDELGLKEIALFPTSLNTAERQELYQLLENTGLTRIPHVHLRSDMEPSELDYLIGKFGTQIFNIHSARSTYPPSANWNNYLKRIYVENTVVNTPTADDLKKYAGLCLDLSHWESFVLADIREANAGELKFFSQNYKIGCNHIAAIKQEKSSYVDRFTGEEFFSHDCHWLDDLRELDYVKKYKNYLADIISIELENPLKQQLEVKRYLEKILF